MGKLLFLLLIFNLQSSFAQNGVGFINKDTEIYDITSCASMLKKTKTDVENGTKVIVIYSTKCYKNNEFYYVRYYINKQYGIGLVDTADVQLSNESKNKLYSSIPSDIDSIYKEFELQVKISNKLDSLNLKRDSLQKIIDLDDLVERGIKNKVVIKEFSWGNENDYGSSLYFKIDILNFYSSPVKYAWITVVTLNPVDDIVSHYGKSTTTFKAIGPINKNEHNTYNFENAWYSSIISKIRITNLKVQFMNGVVINFNSKNIPILSERELEILEE